MWLIMVSNGWWWWMLAHHLPSIYRWSIINWLVHIFQLYPLMTVNAEIIASNLGWGWIALCLTSSQFATTIGMSTDINLWVIQWLILNQPWLEATINHHELAAIINSHYWAFWSMDKWGLKKPVKKKCEAQQLLSLR